MDSASRYEILDTIATGDFATVYRARDLELGREVAIKQIHPQFLADPRQLARYWQEAQLLASLRHPNVMTIYDVVRPRGWLILELMQTNLKDHARGEPIDLELLRGVMGGCLGALDFLHGNGVIHGDVKPTNILLDGRGRVVLGDFGLARRASSEEGSLLKGTTKYMAPELLAPEFGPVGPASDLYSLGFSAYELMCGEQFESLFPGLSAFGRDRQIAWMMWHAAADRQLPPIGRVLEGVPEDLAGVVERLVQKDPARRYQSARDVLRDLRHDPSAVAVPPAEDEAALAAAEAAAKKKRRMRMVAVLAMALSLMISIAMLLPEREKPQPPPEPGPTSGVIQKVFPDERRIVLEVGEEPEMIELKPHDRYFLNEDSVLLRELMPNDNVTISVVRDESGRRILEVHAHRPVVHKGRVLEVDKELGQLRFAITEGKDEGKEQTVVVPIGVKIARNDQTKYQGRLLTLADLQRDDRVEVSHKAGKTERVATGIKTYRVVPEQGTLREVDAEARTIKLAVGNVVNPWIETLPVSPDVEITLNGLGVIEGRLLRLSDLKPGDHAAVKHDTHVVRIDAHRMIGETAVIREIRYEPPQTVEAVRQGSDAPVTYLVPDVCKITLGGHVAGLTDLRVGDLIEVGHESVDARTPTLATLDARRPPDPDRHAVLVGIGQYDDASLPELAYAVDDATLMRETLIGRYRVPEQQALLLADESLVRLRQGIPEHLASAGPGDEVIVYFAGHAFRDRDGTVYLATKHFDLARMSETGLPLGWLVGELEKCPAKVKLLLLDACHAEAGAVTDRQPSTAEMIASLPAPPGRSPLKTVFAIASCQAGQRGLVSGSRGHGLFAWVLAEAYAGRADKNRDTRLEPSELDSYLSEAMTSTSGQLADSQVPRLFSPDESPPRLSEEAKDAIRRLAALASQTKPDLLEAAQRFHTAQAAAGKEPEPRLIYALLLVMGFEQDQAAAQLQEVRVERPELLLAPQGLAWLLFERRKFTPGVDELIAAVNAVPDPKEADEPFSRVGQSAFYFAGQLREFAALAAPENWRPAPDVLARLDAAVARRGERASTWYESGRAKTKEIVGGFDRKIADPGATAADVAKLKVERRRLVNYARFPYIVNQVLSGIDR